MIDIKHNVITNKSNWQEANLLEKLTWLGGGVNFCWVCAAGLSEPVPIILIVYSVTKNRPNLSYFWENVIFTIPAVNIQGMVQIITTPAHQLCPLEAKSGITWQVIKCTKFLYFLFILFSLLIVVLFP